MRSHRKGEAMKELGAALRRRRKSLGLSQEKLAQFAGCSWNYIHYLETGKTSVQLHKLLDVLKVLGLQLTLEPGKAVLKVKDL
jgi:HTH-type transcriptional regulator / antitoxin HipB